MNHTPALHPSVTGVVETYLRAVDAEAPGVVEGLYLTGSVPLGDFRPGTSDVDFVAVTSAPPEDSVVRSLDRAHTRLTARHRRPNFDGPYVTWNELRGDPALAANGPHAFEGRLHPHANADRIPVVWHTLAQCGLAVRGPDPDSVEIWTDRDVLAAWTLGNLDAYWRPWHTNTSRWTTVRGAASLGGSAVSWGVLGVSRLLYTLATGAITSKDGAGRHALEALPSRWHRIVEESLRIRRRSAGRSLYREPFTRRGDALAFVDMAITDAQRPG